MNSNKVRTSKLTLRSDRAVGISSSRYGANLDVVGFNLVFITERSPKLAVEILGLWRQASQLTPDDPKAHDEDYLAAKDQLDALTSSDAGPEATA